jgi:hypothetical protein
VINFVWFKNKQFLIVIVVDPVSACLDVSMGPGRMNNERVNFFYSAIVNTYAVGRDKRWYDSCLPSSSKRAEDVVQCILGK